MTLSFLIIFSEILCIHKSLCSNLMLKNIHDYIFLFSLNSLSFAIVYWILFFSSARLVLLLFTTSPTRFPCISRGQLPSTRIVGTNRVANCAVPKYCSAHQSRVQLRSTKKCAPIAWPIAQYP